MLPGLVLALGEVGQTGIIFSGIVTEEKSETFIIS